MSDSDWIKLTLLCLAGATSPGLSWLLILSMSASRGTAVGISGALGHGLGIMVFALTTVFGLSVLLLALPELTVALTLLGIGLLVYFGYQLVMAGDMPLPEKLTTQGGFIAGFSIAIVNPKYRRGTHRHRAQTTARRWTHSARQSTDRHPVDCRWSLDFHARDFKFPLNNR
jgi:threonine/homoserine/homoserine lactone efflux protein